MKTKFFLALNIAAGLAACHLQAQGTLTATASLLKQARQAARYIYSLTLTNTGSNPINAFWYGWTVGSFNLPSDPTSPAGPSGWTASVLGASIQFGNSSGSAIAPGGTATFTFECTNTPTQMTTGTHQGDPTGESVAYATVASMNAGQQSVPGVASGPFTPTLNPGTVSAAAIVTETGTFRQRVSLLIDSDQLGQQPHQRLLVWLDQRQFQPSLRSHQYRPTRRLDGHRGLRLHSIREQYRQPHCAGGHRNLHLR